MDICVYFDVCVLTHSVISSSQWQLDSPPQHYTGFILPSPLSLSISSSPTVRNLPLLFPGMNLFICLILALIQLKQFWNWEPMSQSKTNLLTTVLCLCAVLQPMLKTICVSFSFPLKIQRKKEYKNSNDSSLDSISLYTNTVAMYNF